MVASPESPSPVAHDPGAAGEGTYRSLYRRFRPQRFDEVKGQGHVTVALRNAVRDGRVTHAYLFSGPRGTGKTSTARILAKALNCEAPDAGEPCGGCASCVAIAAGSSFDVHELDAASTNGVEAMRDLVARAALATPGRWKVYIVDEVHMLSTAASNALLKTLEEPPDHVVFVLATTDPQKVLPTIRSRTQHYEFHLLDDDVLAPLLAEVASSADLELPEGALAAALRQGRGSARDALSALDQVAAGGVVVEEEATLAPVLGALGDRDVAAALSAVDTAVRAGRDPQLLAVDLVERLRRAFFLLVAPTLRPPGERGPEPGELEAASALGTARIVRAIEVLGAAIVAMREAPEPRVALEVALVRLAHPEADDSPGALLERLERLERRLADGPPTGSAPPVAAAPSTRPVPPLPGGPLPPTAAPSTAPPGPTPAPGGAGGGHGATTRPALGAFRRSGGASPETPSAGEAAPLPLAEASTRPAGERGADEPGGGSPAVDDPPVDDPTVPPATATATATPSREELVAAWGDQVLVGLRPKVRAIFQAGRFVGGGAEGASFALPNEAHLVHAEPLRQEVAEALGRHFGVPVRLRLVVDPGTVAPGRGEDPGEALGEAGGAGPAPSAASADALGGSASASATADEGLLDDSDAHEVDDLAEGPSGPAGGITWAEDRLRKAFPGAEEV